MGGGIYPGLDAEHTEKHRSWTTFPENGEVFKNLVGGGIYCTAYEYCVSSRGSRGDILAFPRSALCRSIITFLAIVEHFGHRS